MLAGTSLDAAIASTLNQTPMPAAVLLGAQVTGLAIARSLGRRGVPVLALDPDCQALAAASRFVVGSGPLPSPLEDEPAFVRRLAALGRALARPAVLFPTGDEWASALARNADRLGEAFVLPPADDATIGRILHKGHLYREARALGIPVPGFVEVGPGRRPVSLDEIASAVGFPCVVKPGEKRDFVKRSGQAALVAAGPGQLGDVLAQFDGDAVVQELVPSDDPVLQTVATYVDRAGTVRGSFVGRRLAVFPPGFGTSCLVEAADDAELVESATFLLRRLGYRGIAEVEFILDERDATWKLIDVNPRPWKWVGLPIHAGLDLPWLAYADALGLPSEPVSPAAGVRWTSIHDLAALTAQTGRSLVGDAEWQALLQGRANGRIVDATFDPDDVLPFVRAMENAHGAGARACPC
jgi:predicted ATP-grasp superfamily ATP-dependent carboligase